MKVKALLGPLSPSGERDSFVIAPALDPALHCFHHHYHDATLPPILTLFLLPEATPAAHRITHPLPKVSSPTTPFVDAATQRPRPMVTSQHATLQSMVVPTPLAQSSSKRNHVYNRWFHLKRVINVA